MVDPHLQIVPEDIRHLPMVHIDRCESAVGQCGPRFYEGLEVKSPALFTSNAVEDVFQSVLGSREHEQVSVKGLKIVLAHPDLVVVNGISFKVRRVLIFLLLQPVREEVGGISIANGNGGS